MKAFTNLKGFELKTFSFGDSFIRGDGDSITMQTVGKPGPAESNSAVMACLAWVMDTLPEAKPRIMREKGDEDEVIDPHNALSLVKSPHPYISWVDIVGAIGVSLGLDGNAYLRVRYNKFFKLQLEYIPHTVIEPKCVFGRESEGLAYYEITRGWAIERVDPKEIIHFRQGIDLQNGMKGCSRMKSVMLEVLTDNEAVVYSHSILKNMGVIGLVLAPKDKEQEIEPEQAKSLMDYVKRWFTGKGRGNAFVATSPMEITQLESSPEKMALKETRMGPETRICAMFRLHPSVVGLMAGLEHSTYSNMEQAFKAAYLGCNAPMWRRIADTFTKRLQELKLLKEDEYFDFDLKTVQYLQESENDRAERFGKAFERGGLKRSEYRRELGYESETTDEVYIQDIQRSMQPEKILKEEGDKASERAKSLALIDEWEQEEAA